MTLLKSPSPLSNCLNATLFLVDGRQNLKSSYLYEIFDCNHEPACKAVEFVKKDVGETILCKTFLGPGTLRCDVDIHGLLWQVVALPFSKPEIVTCVITGATECFRAESFAHLKSGHCELPIEEQVNNPLGFVKVCFVRSFCTSINYPSRFDVISGPIHTSIPTASHFLRAKMLYSNSNAREEPISLSLKRFYKHLLIFYFKPQCIQTFTLYCKGITPPESLFTSLYIVQLYIIERTIDISIYMHAKALYISLSQKSPPHPSIHLNQSFLMALIHFHFTCQIF